MHNKMQTRTAQSSSLAANSLALAVVFLTLSLHHPPQNPFTKPLQYRGVNAAKKTAAEQLHCTALRTQLCSFKTQVLYYFNNWTLK